MSIRLLLVINILFVNTVAAQKGKDYLVKAGEKPNEALPTEAMYVLPAFISGTAWFRNGTSSVQRFNYNFLLDEMHFIEAGKDTLAIANPELIKSVMIDSMVFYYDKGYLREFFRAGTYSLGVRQKMIEVLNKTRGAYDAASGSASIKTYETVNINSPTYKLQVKKDVLFQETRSFYLRTGLNPFLKANRKNFHMLFWEKDVTKYVKEHKIDFNKEEDLIELLKFCAP